MAIFGYLLAALGTLAWYRVVNPRKPGLRAANHRRAMAKFRAIEKLNTF